MIGKKIGKILFTGLVFLALLFLWSPQSVGATGTFTDIEDEGGVTACDDLSSDECTQPPTLHLVEIWAIKALYIAWAVGGIIFLVGLVSIGFRWLTSGGDQQKLEELKKQATYWAISIPIFFGGVPAISFVLQVFPINQEATCLQDTSLPGFQIIFPNVCRPGTIGSDDDGIGGCCDDESDCPAPTGPRGYTCDVVNTLCSSGKSCQPR